MTERESLGCYACVLCDGDEHHWMMDADAAHPEGHMVCKHCDATRPLRDDDFEDEDVEDEDDAC